jgi:endonuclease-3
MKTPAIPLPPKQRAAQTIELLSNLYPDAKTALNYTNPLELLVATILSAQTTDAQVNKVTQTLFKKYKTAKDYATAPLAQLEEDIHSTGFYRNKAKNLKACAQMLLDRFHGEVPQTMEELIQLPGVARKTANIVLYFAFGITAGVAVDTHVMRLSQRLGLTAEKDQDKIERDLMALLPKEQWMPLTNLLILHGRLVCTAKKPRCDICVLNKICPSAFTFG